MIALPVLIALAACKAGAPNHDAAAVAAPAIPGAPDPCTTAIAPLEGVELASIDANMSGVEPLARSLNRITDLSGTPPPTSEVMADVKARTVAALEKNWPARAAAMADECRLGGWPADVRACYARIRSAADVDACNRGLHGWQLRRLKAAVVRVVETNPQRQALRVSAILRPVECSSYLLYGKAAQKCMRLSPQERDRIATDVARDSASWNLDGDTDVLVAPCEAGAERIAARLEAVKCKLEDLVGL